MTQADHVAVADDEHGVGQQDRGRRSLASPQRLRSFFAPRSIALVGASEGSGWARFTLDSLSTSGFTGELRLVHPVRPQAFGRPPVPSLRALDEPVDLAFVLAPTRAVEGVLEDAAAAGIHNVVVLASGYGDGGGEEGRERERRLVERAVELDLTLLGPNCLGFVNAAAGVAPFGLHIVPPLRRGGLGVVLQSGALTSNVLAFARAHGIGISLLTSMGNEAVIPAADVIEHLVDDDETRVIGLFLESVRDPQRFTALAERALQVGKPIVALKVGRSPAGQLAALAHTGARAGGREKLLITAGVLGSGTVPTGRRMGVVTASGGACDIIADRSADEGVEIPEFSEPTEARLREVLPSFAAARNPLDVTGVILADRATASANLGGTALNTVAADPNLDFVLNLVTLPVAAPPDPAVPERRMADIVEANRRSPIPIVHFSATCSDLSDYGGDLLDRHGLHVVGGIEFGLKAVGHAIRWNELRHDRATNPAPAPSPAPSVAPADAPEGAWSEARARDLLRATGVPAVPAELVNDADAAVAAAERLGHPVALKICSAAITHKSDIGGVAPGLGGAVRVRC